VKDLKDRLELAKTMLRILGERTMHRTDWNILCRINSTRFGRMLAFLMEKGYVERLERGIYKRTERGRLFVESI